MYTSSLYKNSPIFVQNILASIYGLAKTLVRESKYSNHVKDELKSNEKNIERLSSYATKQLNFSLRNAVNHVPFYSSYSSNLNEFPYIDKTVVRESTSKLQNRSYRGPVIKGSTSGTTGTPLKIFQSKQSVERERAFANRQREWAGFKKGDKRAWIRGDVIVPILQNKPPYWRYSWFENMLLLSSFHMTKDVLPLYIKAMVDYGVDIIQAYPSSIATLAHYLEAKDEYYPGKLKSILTSSETLTVEDRQLIEKRFGCKVYDWYGLFERVAAIANCEYGRYHVLTDYSHVEFLEVGDGRHEIVGTNFNNEYFPLIRYKSGDHVVLSQEDKCFCGRVYPMVERIDGRVGDYLVGENGQKVFILNHIPKGIIGLLACQFVQAEPKSIDVLAVVDEKKFDNKQALYLKNNVKERLGKNMQVSIRYVNALPRTKNGKVRQAVCSL